MSSASDTITKLLFWEIFPKEFSQLVYPYLGNLVTVNGKTRPMQTMSTSGNALTFVLESLVFGAVNQAAANWLRTWGEQIPKDVVYVYGDDQVVRTEVFDASCQFAKALGFIVNDSKSYSTGSFRESCGGDYWDGIDVSSVYYPRFPVEGTISKGKISFSKRLRRDSYRGVYTDSLMRIIDLQHRLYYVCYPAARLLAEVVWGVKPSMTTSHPGTDLSDLWEYDCTSFEGYAPAGEFVEKPNPDKWGKPIHELKSVRSAVERPRKLLPVIRWSNTINGKEIKIPSQAERLYDIYKYQEFLRHGPRYEDEWCRLAGVSSPFRTLSEIFAVPVIEWSRSTFEI
jgi:hypothetical protein